jgi:hypothetical protein
VTGAVLVGTAAATAALALAVVSFLRGRMSQTDLSAVLQATLSPDTVATLRAEAELAAVMSIYDRLGSVPPRFNIGANDNDCSAIGAHTIEHHGPNMPLPRGAPGIRTVEGRIYGDQPWRRTEKGSYRWVNASIMNRTINEYVAANWERIRSDLAMEGTFVTRFEAGRMVGEGYFNEGMYGAGSTMARYSTTSHVRLRIRLVPGSDPPQPYIVTAFPSALF